MPEPTNEPQPLLGSEFALIDEGKTDWFTLRLLATIKAKNVEIKQLQAQLNTKPQRSRSKKEKTEEALRESDLTAQLAGRDNIEYGHHESLPRGEHVARGSQDKR